MVSTMSLIGKEIGELLVDGGYLTPDQLEIAEQEKLNTGETISRILTRMGLASENQIKDTLELQYGVTYVSLQKSTPKAEIVNLLPEKFIRQHQVLPIDYQSKRLTLAMVNPDDPLSVIDIKNHIQFEHLKPVVCLEDDFESFVEVFFAPPEPEPLPEPEPKSESKPETVAEPPVEATVQVETTAKAEAEMPPAPADEATTNGVVDLGDLLVSEGILDDDQLFAALKRCLKEKKELSDVLVQMKLITADKLAEVLNKANAVNEPVVSATETITNNGKGLSSKPTIELSAAMLAAEQSFADVLEKTETAKPTGSVSEEGITASPVFDAMRRTVNEAQFDLAAAFGPVKGADEIDSPDPIVQYSDLEDDIDFLELVKQAQDASISLVANHITLSAVESRCSDIHIHGTSDDLVVQYFAQGNLVTESRLEKQLLAELVACYKDIAGLNRFELVKPQDKRIRMRVADTDVDLRITTIPEESGEMVAITLKYLSA